MKTHKLQVTLSAPDGWGEPEIVRAFAVGIGELVHDGFTDDPKANQVLASVSHVSVSMPLDDATDTLTRVRAVVDPFLAASENDCADTLDAGAVLASVCAIVRPAAGE
jgi:hypothetical protein